MVIFPLAPDQTIAQISDENKMIRGVYPYLLMAQVSHGQFWGESFQVYFIYFVS